jgi:hypothetical protein
MGHLVEHHLVQQRGTEVVSNVDHAPNGVRDSKLRVAGAIDKTGVARRNADDPPNVSVDGERAH